MTDFQHSEFETRTDNAQEMMSEEALGNYRTIGLPMGEQANLRMPLVDFETLRTRVAVQTCDCTPLV